MRMTGQLCRRLGLLAAICVLGASLAWAEPTAAPAKTLDFANLLPDVLGMIGKADVSPMTLKTGDKICFMGDSITQQGGYVRLADGLLKQAYPNMKVAFINAGISGQQAEHMQPRFEKDMKLAEKPAYCFINVGINDVWHRMGKPHDPAVLDAYKANVTKMVESAQAAGATAVLLTPTVISEDPKADSNARLTMYVDAMKQIAADKKCQLIDLHAMFLSAIDAKPKTLSLTRDGVHMKPYGDAIMAIGVLRALGVPDATIAAADMTTLLQVPALRKSLTDAAKILEVPANRFFKPELTDLLSF